MARAATRVSRSASSASSSALPPESSAKAPDAPEPPAAPERSRRLESSLGGRRLALPIDERGHVQTDRLRASTREDLKRLLTDPSLPQALGLAPDAGPMTLPPVLGATLTKTIADLDLIIVARMAGVTPAQAAAVAWTADERAQLEAPLMTVLSKYAGSVLSRWGDEIALAFVLVSVTQAKVFALQAMHQGKGPSPVVPFAAPKRDDEPATDDAPAASEDDK